jgi:hypothetical protein
MRRTLAALGRQQIAAEVHCELVLANHNSTDSTDRVCRDFSVRHSMITAVRRDPEAFCRQSDVIDELGAAWGYAKKWWRQRSSA